MSASGETCPVSGDFAFTRCLTAGAFQWMSRGLKTLPASEVGKDSEPPAVSEITARLAYVAMTATTSKLAANMPRLRVNGGAFFASPHRIVAADPLLRLQHCIGIRADNASPFLGSVRSPPLMLSEHTARTAAIRRERLETVN